MENPEQLITKISRLRGDALSAFEAGVAAAEPQAAVRRTLRTSNAGRPVIAGEEVAAGTRLLVVSFGKAACTMAKAVASVVPEEVFPGPGIAVVNAENRREVSRFRVRSSGHPVPDRAGVQAAEEVTRYVDSATEKDAVLVLVSGGGSALLPAPSEGVTLEDKMETTLQLLACGATIHEMNAVRKHLSTLKGGGLARRAAPARIEAHLLSDVIGDDLSTIASGPTVADPTTFADARGILEKYGILETVPTAIAERLERGDHGEVPETPKPGDPIFDRVNNVLVGSNRQSLDAAAERAKALGYEVVIASRELCGDARDAAAALSRHVRQRATTARPVAILAGGETTVTVKGSGRGGRNQEMALHFALACKDMQVKFPWVFLSGGTDGRDGPTDAAGGLVDPCTLSRGATAGHNVETELENNNSYRFLEASGDLLKTGATGTNVADLQVLLVARALPLL